MAAICMLNALWFKPDGGAEMYAEYGEAAAPILDGVGAEMLFPPLPVVQSLEGDFDPDLILLVRYPSKEAFGGMWRTDEYAKIAHLRTDAITKAVLTRCALEPAETPAITELPPGIILFEALTFHEGGRENYDEYLRRANALSEPRGASVLSPKLTPLKSLAEEFMPDLVMLAHYPSLETLYEMASTPEYQEFAPLRGQAVKHGTTVVCHR
jgi:uncharacterized protein (DUF1330 family)